MRALSLLPPIRQGSVIFDAGCGPGRASMVLAAALKQKIIAVDLCEDFLSALQAAASAQGMGDLIEARCANMAKLDATPKSINLIWSEGAIYCIGFDNGLSLWRPLLAEDGLIACTELSWLTAQQSEESSQFWNAAYPGMRSISENLMAAESLGYACLDYFVLPESCWWDEYYGPLSHNIEQLKSEDKRDDYLCRAIENAATEIEMFRQYSNEYGYVFYLLQKSNVSIERANDSDASAIARVFRQSRALLTFLPCLHTEEEDLQFFAKKILPTHTVFVAKESDSDNIVGFITFDHRWVHQLYLVPDQIHTGIGSRLLNLVKSKTDRLQLWAFKKNVMAAKFYAKHGFKPIEETDGSNNEEKEPDVLFEWIRANEIQK